MNNKNGNSGFNRALVGITLANLCTNIKYAHIMVNTDVRTKMLI